jgi:hypothetical protein
VAGEGVIVDCYVEAVLLEQAAGAGKEKREIEHDKRRALESVAEVHGGVEAAGKKVAGREQWRHFGGDEDEAAAGLEGGGDPLDEARLIVGQNVAEEPTVRATSNSWRKFISRTSPMTKSIDGR